MTSLAMNADPLHPTILVGVAALLSACVATDVRSRRIPNAITAPAIVAGTGLNYSLHGVDGIVAALGGLALGLLILTPPFALGGLGGGDVKMMGAAGAFLGPTLLAYSIGAGLVVGGVIAVLAAARRGRLRETLRRTWAMTLGAIVTGSAAPLRVPTTLPDRILLPYSVPLALGTLFTVAWTVVARS